MVKLNLLLTEFSKRYRLENELVADEKGIYSIVVDDMDVKCFEKFGNGYLSSKLITLSEQENNVPVVLKDLMHHALARIKSQNCSLGLGENNDLVLFQRFDIETMNLYDFSETLENFTNTLEEYRHFVGSQNTKETSVGTMIITP